MSQKIKKLEIISVNFTSIIEKKIEGKKELEKISYIWYFITFKNEIEILLDPKNKVYIMIQAFIY